MKQVLMMMAMVAMVGGLSVGFAFNETDEENGSPMAASEAMEIAQNSSCVLDSWFTGDAFYNEHTGTWWFDLDINKEGCSPACVVNTETGEAEINWRCTGLVPSEEDKVQVGVPLIGSPPGPGLPDNVNLPKEATH